MTIINSSRGIISSTFFLYGIWLQASAPGAPGSLTWAPMVLRTLEPHDLLMHLVAWECLLVILVNRTARYFNKIKVQRLWSVALLINPYLGYFIIWITFRTLDAQKNLHYGVVPQRPHELQPVPFPYKKKVEIISPF